jgi:hypothetical protein
VHWGGGSSTSELLINLYWVLTNIGRHIYGVLVIASEVQGGSGQDSWWRLWLAEHSYWSQGRVFQRRQKIPWTVRFSYFYLCECDVWNLTLNLCFLWRYAIFDGVIDTREARPLRESSSRSSSGASERLFQRGIELLPMQEKLRLAKEMIQIQEALSQAQQ